MNDELPVAVATPVVPMAPEEEEEGVGPALDEDWLLCEAVYKIKKHFQNVFKYT